jgi:beta-galactosidase/beta-glucuronidase
MLNNGCQPTPLSAEHPILAGYIPIEQKTISLNGDWIFSADPARIAAEEKWFEPGFDASTWQVVSVPHTWNVMKLKG